MVSRSAWETPDGINSATLNNLGFPCGDVRVLSATLDPIVHLNPNGYVDLYVIGVAEARYHRIFLSRYGHMDYVPVSFGFRW